MMVETVPCTCGASAYPIMRENASQTMREYFYMCAERCGFVGKKFSVEMPADDFSMMLALSGAGLEWNAMISEKKEGNGP